MAFLQIIPLGLLLLDVSSGLASEFSNFSCESYPGEHGKNTTITCKNSQYIRGATVTFCSSNISCADESEINTFDGKYTSSDGRISLKLNSFAILSFNQVQILDERYYKIFLLSDNGYTEQFEFLKVIAPYTKPQLTRKNDTLVCTADGGYPVKHLYWYDSHGTNLTYNSTFVSTRGVDGSFSLNSSLQLDSLAHEMIYCCILNDTGSSHSLQSSNCMTVGNPEFSKLVSENPTHNYILTPVLLIIILLVGIAIALSYWRKNKDHRYYEMRGIFQRFLSLRREPVPEEDLERGKRLKNILLHF